MKTRNSIAVFMVLHIMCLLLLDNTSTASPVDNYSEEYSLDGDETGLMSDQEEYMDKEMEDEGLVFTFSDVQKRKIPDYKYIKSCVPRGGNCDHRPKNCCNSSFCRCNLWGVNCKCQRMGIFQYWEK